MAGAQHRQVRYMHRTLNGIRSQEQRIFGESKNLTKRQVGMNHHAIFVFDMDPTQEQRVDFVRFELAIPEGHKGIVVMEVVPGTGNLAMLNQDGWRGARQLWGMEGIYGITSLDNQSIAYIGGALIEDKFKAGSYSLLTNSCQQFAIYLFNKVCDIKGSKQATVEGMIAGEVRNLAIAGAAVGAAAWASTR